VCNIQHLETMPLPHSIVSRVLAPPSRGSLGGRPDIFCAGVVALVTAAIYLATLQPDFGGPEDTPKFQFLGYVLGTGHPPGYPLYVMLSHLFVRTLRVGTIAYRANLFSAMMAVLSCVAVFTVARVLGGSRWAAVCAAVALATGPSFWRSAVFAEVYSLAAAVVGVSLALLLTWGVRGTAVLLMAAIATTAAGFGNHLTIVGVIPAYVAYVLWREHRVLTPRFVAVAALLVALGVAQYGFVIVRTRQQAPYLESRASTASELVDVVLARRFADQRFAYSPKTLLTVHLPVVAETIGKDLNAVGLVMFGAGVFASIVAFWSVPAVVIGAGTGVLAMVVNLGGDVKGFITPLMIFVWPFAALGSDVLGRLIAIASGRRAVGVVAGAVAATLMPVVNISANYKTADQSGQTDSAEFIRALHQQLPDGAAVVAEDYFYDMALRYYRLTGEAPGNRRLQSVTFDASMVRAVADGTIGGHPRPVFAFAAAATYFAAEGLRFVPVPIQGSSLSDWLARLPSGAILVGASAYLPSPLDLASVGHATARPPGRVQNFETFAVVVGASGEKWTKHHRASALVVDSPTIGARLPNFPGTLRAIGDGNGARIQLDDRTVVAVTSGIALAVFRSDGTLMRGLEFPDPGPWTVPFPAVVYQFIGEAPCLRLEADKWSDVSSVFATGSAVSTLFRTGTAMIDTVTSDGSPVMTATTAILGDAIGRDIGVPSDPDEGQFWRSEFTRTGGRRSVFRIALDRVASKVKARFRSNQEDSAILCGFPPVPLFRNSGNVATIEPDVVHESYFGPGWSGVEGIDSGRVRRADARATLFLPLAYDYTYRLTLDLSAELQVRTEVFLDGVATGQCDTREERACTVELQPKQTGPVSAVTFVTRAHDGSLVPPRRLTLRGGKVERRRLE
jgi:hypothetical protein